MEAVPFEEVLRGIAGQPGPVVFLDTCAILDIPRALYRSEQLPMDLPRAAAIFSEQATASDRRVWLVSSEIVVKELRDGRQRVAEDLANQVGRLLRQLRHIVGAGQMLLPDHRLSEPHLPETKLADRAFELMDGLMASIVLVQKTDDLVAAARARSLAGLAPAKDRKGSFADCLILETFLKVSVGARELGVGPCVLVTSNTDDFGAPPGKDLLAAEIETAAGMYVGNLSEALRLVESRKAQGAPRWIRGAP